jgi:hypothetical protein
MNDSFSPSEENAGKPRFSASKAVRFLALLVGIEAVLVSSGAVYFLTLTFTEVTSNIAGAIVIFLITALIAVGLWVSTFALLQGKSWSRGIIITWQVIQFAMATSFIQGLVEWQAVGWALLMLSLVTFFIALRKKVSESLEPRD